MPFPSLSRFLVAGIVAILAAGCASRPPGPPPVPTSPINYYVRVVRAGVDRYDVSLAADRVRADSIDFVLPAWLPGRYTAGPEASTLENFSVRDGRGSAVATRRLGSNRWRLYPARADYLTIGYQIVPGPGPGPLAFRTLLDLEGGYSIGAGLFGYLEGHGGRAVTVAFELPSQWTAVTPLEQTSARRYSAPGFEALAEAPILVGGGMRDYKLFVEGRTHQVVVQGAGADFDPDSLLTLIGETVRHGTGFYGAPPYGRYLFAFRFVSPGTVGIGAAGQAAGSAYFLPRLDSDRVRQSGIGGVLLHQYLHAWYPGGFGPVDLVRPDFSVQPSVPAAWLIEGAAEYYARLLPGRQGDDGRSAFYESMGELLTWWREMGGGSSIDVASLGPDGGRDGSAARLVVGGSLAAFVTDVAIRADTRGSAGLDQVLFYLQRRVPPGGYDPNLIWDEVATMLAIPPDGLSPLSRGSSLSIESGLARAGLRVVERAERRRTLGARLHVDPSGRFVVRAVEPGGTAASAGLRDGDLLVKINGTPIGPDETVATRYALVSYIRDAAPGARVTFGVVRAGQPLEEVGTVRESRIPSVTIDEIAGASASALLVRSSLFSPPDPAPAR